MKRSLWLRQTTAQTPSSEKTLTRCMTNSIWAKEEKAHNSQSRVSIAARLRRSDPWAKDSTCRVRCRRCRCPAKSLLARMAVGSRDSLQQQSLSNTASARTTMSIRTWLRTKVADASSKMELRASTTSLWTSLTNSWKVRTHTCSTTSRRGLMRPIIATSSFHRLP